MEYPEWFNTDDWHFGTTSAMWASQEDLAAFAALPLNTEMSGQYVEFDEDNKECYRYTTPGTALASSSPFKAMWMYALLPLKDAKTRLEIKVRDADRVITFYGTPAAGLNVEKFDRDDLCTTEYYAELERRGLPTVPEWLYDRAGSKD